ncbi:hypothetical protein, partial [Microbulbifer discodermiae]|uniref:hypothetical protein n=1 Tax=Microbulbifer sp. 2201CG32-9 TaxID=3232309 RepID=UPI00345B9E7C
QVRQIAGQGAVWPTMEREDIYNLYRVSVRGGSTAKPNQTREREQWVQLLPILQQQLMQIGQLKAVAHPMAGVAEFVLEQTLKRFDERFDLAEIAEQGAEPAGGQLPAPVPPIPPATETMQ